MSIVTDRHTVGPIALDCQHWQPKTKGFLYKDSAAAAGGVQKILLQVASGGGKLLLKLKGDAYGVNAIDGGGGDSTGGFDRPSFS